MQKYFSQAKRKTDKEQNDWLIANITQCDWRKKKKLREITAFFRWNEDFVDALHIEIHFS